MYQKNWKQELISGTSVLLSSMLICTMVFSVASPLFGKSSTQVQAASGLVEIEVSAVQIEKLVERYAKEGAFANDQVARLLTIHLTAVEQYEKQEDVKKILKHMESFKVLLDQQLKNNLISQDAYDALKNAAEELIKKYKKVTSAAELKELVERFAKEGSFKDAETARALTTHLTALVLYEKQENAEKVLKHLEGFKVLLDYQRENKLIAEEVYQSLLIGTDSLVEKWQ